MCLQHFGHVSNDNKMINILTGQGSCRVKYLISCCMERLENLDNPLEWMQRALLEEKLLAGTATPEDHIIIPDAPK